MCRTLNIASAICFLLSLYYFSLCLYGSPQRSSVRDAHVGESPPSAAGANGRDAELRESVSSR
jgi:hypothetical protein